MAASARIFAGPVDLEKLRELRDGMRGPLRSPGTRKAYRSDWGRFEEWCEVAGRQALPAAPDTVSLFMMWLLYEHHAKTATAYRHAAAINAYHRDSSLECPVTQQIRDQILEVRRMRRERSVGKDPLTPEQLESAVSWCEPETAEGARDRALLVIGFASSLRRSELVDLRLADVGFVEDGLTLYVDRSKTDQNAVGRVVPVWSGARELTDPVRLLKAWLDHRGVWSGPLFTRCTSRFGARARREPMSGDSVLYAVRRALNRAGIEDVRRFGAHSLRAGSITASADLGRSDREIQKLSGHKDTRVMQMYIRRTRAFQGRNPLEGVL